MARLFVSYFPGKSAFLFSKKAVVPSLKSSVPKQIPNSVIEIEDHAFRSCNSLKTIQIPNSVTRIGDCAFWGCEKF